MALRLRLSEGWTQPANRKVMLRQVLIEERTDAGELVGASGIVIEVPTGHEGDVNVVLA